MTSEAELITAIRNRTAATLIMYRGPINWRGIEAVSHVIHNSEPSSKCLLFLSTFGGDAHAAFKIARKLRQQFAHLTLLVPKFCKSAGTLLALAADELVIWDDGELGPLDVQVQKMDEVFEVGSGLETLDSVDFLFQKAMNSFRQQLMDLKLGGQIATKLASDISVEFTTGLYSPIFAQIDPVKVGELYRAMQIATEYAVRLKTDNVKPATIKKLVHDYPSHGFVIDRKEAESLFNQVYSPADDVLHLSAHLGWDTESSGEPLVLELLPKLFPDDTDERSTENLESSSDGARCEDHEDGESSSAVLEPGLSEGPPSNPATKNQCVSKSK